MKKKFLLLLGMMAVLVVISMITVKISTLQEGKQKDSEDTLNVVASFYPVYMIALNIGDQVSGMKIDSLTELNTGCLHDYQLTTEDMKLISNADIMIINGGGMESFLTDITENYPELTIIDASEGISMLPIISEHTNGKDSNLSITKAATTSEVIKTTEAIKTTETTEAKEITDSAVNTESTKAPEEGKEALNISDTEEHGEWNAHVWLDPKLYRKQIENVQKGILDYINKNRPGSTTMQQEIENNATDYKNKVAGLDAELNDLASQYEIRDALSKRKLQAVIFHDAFAYLADRLGLQVAHAVPLDSDTALSAGDIAEIVDEVRSENIHFLFTEAQFSDSIAKQIESETDARMYIIDSAVTGDRTKDSYFNAMQKNIQVLREALKGAQN